MERNSLRGSHPTNGSLGFDTILCSKCEVLLLESLLYWCSGNVRILLKVVRIIISIPFIW